MGRYVDKSFLVELQVALLGEQKEEKMAGVVNACRHCKVTVYDRETTHSRCPECSKTDWLDWPRKANPINEVLLPPEQVVPKSHGYHINDIPQGVTGELSKLLEEIHEALDAEQQDNPVMVLAELSDLYGAMTLYLAKHHPTITMLDMEKMSEATHRAFMNGRRQAKK